jgi:FkbM family methyltransferase
MNFVKRALIRFAMNEAAKDGAELASFLRGRGVVAASFACNSGSISVPTNSRSIIESFLSGEYFGAKTVDAFLQIESHASVLFNIGSNVGTSAARIAFAKKYQKIFCFEPEPNNFDLLETNTHNLRSVSCSQLALGRKSDTLQLNLNTDSIGRHSFSTDFGKGSVSVNVETLDSLTDGHDSFDIFMDVEGWEIEVLLGAQLSLERCSVCALEWNGQIYGSRQKIEAIEILKNAGFKKMVDLEQPERLLDISTLAGVDVQKDIAFVR